MKHRMGRQCRHRSVYFLFFLISAVFCISAFRVSGPACAAAETPAGAISSMAGKNDAVLVTTETGASVFSHNSRKKLIPASTLKVLTALAAFHYLGPDYRFPTEFYRTETNDLLIKGYGDPMLVSEAVSDIATVLNSRIDRVQDIVLDGTYFKNPVDIPGVAANTEQPYNAPNGAICVNFNTINFKTRNGRIVSAEPQTPMLPVALSRIKKNNLSAGRVLLSDHFGETLVYAGQLFEYFLTQAGITVSGRIREGALKQQKADLIYRHASEYPLTEITRRLFKYSNNYMANQVLLAAGAAVYGPPATLEKGVTLLRRYCQKHLGITGIELAEGSGISRKNRISATMFERILAEFAVYYDLMPDTDGIYYKTGTLDGIRTRVGYIKSKEGFYRFVILLNTKGKRTEPIIKEMKKLIQ